MPNFGRRAVGSKRLNSVFADYPNAYWTVHEGLAGTDPGDIPDQNGSGLVLAPATATTAQWTTKPGYWSGTSTNTTDYLVCSRSDDITTYDSIFNFDNTTIVIMGYVFSDTDPLAVTRHFCFGNSNPGVAKYIDGKFLTTGVIQVITDFGTLDSANGVDLPAQAAPNESVVILKLDCSAETITIMCFDPATKTLQLLEAETALTAPTFPTSNPTNSTFSVGAVASASAFTNQAQNISIRDVRVINFSSTPPSDLSAILEELAINCCLGTSR